MNTPSRIKKGTSEATWAMYRKTLSNRVRDQIATENDRLALKVAHRMSAQCAEPFEDLSQIARMGLLKAIPRFNPEKGNAFSSFAVPYIRGEILHFLRDHGSDVKIPRRWREIYAKGQRYVERQRSTCPSYQPTDLEIADYLDVNVQRWIEIREAIGLQASVSLDELLQVPDSEPSMTPEESDLAKQEIWNDLVRLCDPYRSCLADRIFRGLSVEAIAEALGVEATKVYEWIETGLHMLRTQAEEAI